MSNHSDRGSPIPEAIAQALREPLIGATGLHTEGKLTPTDEGGIQWDRQHSHAEYLMKFSFWKWLRCVVTLNHFDPGVIVVRGRECYCKRCGIRAD